ncbi:N-acetylmuramoyl-L-alanine amidase [Cognatishimia sp. WU-CL00825]|uniref:N-acetylmuramoyl-L-alanine amidase n=1 Tax=Cognatishimia sp. WU-CL00825 TaxID=3127658 RepID=UPI00310C8289
MGSEAIDIIQYPSGNFGPRRENARPSLVVIHYTAMSDAQSALDTLCNPNTEVSAHYLIAADGRVFQMVDEAARAWHAGAGRWGDITDVNSHSIGIELDNKGDHGFSEPLMASLELLLEGVLKRWDIKPKGVIAHSDLAPQRKIDPGKRFDWARLAKRDLALWPDDKISTEEWAQSARTFGYPLDCDPDPEKANNLCFQAFRSRFCPWKTGAEDAEDRRIMARLVAQATS